MKFKYISLTHPPFSSEVLELRHMLSMCEEECLGGVVGSHLVILLEGGLSEAELGDTSVEVDLPHDGEEAEPQDLVAEGGTLGGLEFSQVQFAGEGWRLRSQLVYCLAVHLFKCKIILINQSSECVR
jgi:hypothetical protein